MVLQISTLYLIAVLVQHTLRL